MGLNSEDTKNIASLSSSADAQSFTQDEGTFEAEASAAEVLSGCRAALVSGPSTSRAALAKHRASIEPALAKTMEIAGSYTLEVLLPWNLVHTCAYPVFPYIS